MSRILVIRLGAFGDFVLSFGPFAAIRARHPDAEITLLTTAPFAEFASAAPWFDRVVVDRRPKPWNLPAIWRLRSSLRGYSFVYDLQTSERSGWYFRAAGRPPWSGIAPGCSHPHANFRRDVMHTVERQREQLAMAGIEAFPEPDLAWLRGPAAAGGEQPPVALLIPGASPHRPRKRWPAGHFGELAHQLAGQGWLPVVVGSAADAPLAAVIRTACPGAIDLTGQTTLLQLARVAAPARVAIGNDTGPTHLAAALGVRTVALFSADSDPALTRPRGDVSVIAVTDLADLPVARVAAAIAPVHAPRFANELEAT